MNFFRTLTIGFLSNNNFDDFHGSSSYDRYLKIVQIDTDKQQRDKAVGVALLLNDTAIGGATTIDSGIKYAVVC
jgi:hypothetical protein